MGLGMGRAGRGMACEWTERGGVCIGTRAQARDTPLVVVAFETKRFGRRQTKDRFRASRSGWTLRAVVDALRGRP
jgi:hypothetical protein